MPRFWFRVAIVVFWLGMTGALVRRDVLPRLGFGELSYPLVLANRAVEEPVHWNIFVNDKRVGSITTVIRPADDGSYDFNTRASVAGTLLGEDQHGSGGNLIAQSEFHVSPLGRLRKFNLSVYLDGTTFGVDVRGAVDGNSLHLVSKGLAKLLDREVTVAIDPEILILDELGPLDRLPGLRPGKTWTTRIANPLSIFTSPSSIFSGPTLETVTHRVVGTDVLAWEGRPWPCYLVEQRRGDLVARTWATIESGKVLRQELPFGGYTLAIVLDSPQGKSP